MGTRTTSVALLATALAATLVVYAGVLGCFFWADDIVFLYDARNGAPLEFLLTPYGGHLSWVRNLLFLVLERLVGPKPEPFFAVALVTHVVNVALCFAVVRAFTGSALLAAVWAMIWGTSPRNAATLFWFAGHAQMLVGTIMLVLLWRAAVLLARGAEPTARDAWGAVVLSVIAAGSFGVGLAVGLAVPLAALLLFPQMAPSRRRVLLGLLVLLPLLYLVGLVLNALVGTRSLAPNTPSLIGAIPNVVKSTVLLLGNGLAGLLAGFTLTGPIPASLAFGAAAGLAVVLAAALVVCDRASRRLLLAVTLMPLAIYGITAAGRVPVMFFGGPERLALTPRYHYAGPLALAVLAALLCVALGRRSRLPGAAGPIVAALVLAIDAIAFVRTDWRLDQHRWVAERTHALLDDVDKAAANTPAGTDVVHPNVVVNGVGPMFAKVPKVFPRLAGLWIAFRDDDAIDGRPLRFAESDEAVYAYVTADPRKRIAHLLVPVPPAP